MDLAGRTLLITDGPGDLGRAISLGCAAAGARLLIGYAHDRPAAAALAEQCRQHGPAAVVQLDVRDPASVRAAIAAGLERYGALDGLVHNAQVSRAAYVLTTRDTSWAELLQTDLYAALGCVEAALPALAAGPGASALVTMSLGARYGVSGHAGQSAAEATLLALIGELARVAAPVRVNALLYGFIETAYTAAAEPSVRARHLPDIPLGRYGQPDEVAAAATFLISRAAGYITGQSLAVDGGLSGASYLCWRMLGSGRELH